MPDSKITALTSISTSTDPANDPLVIVDVSDTSMAATGTTKKVTLNQLLGASGTATLASATITGDLTVDTSTLKVDSANDVVGVGTASPNGWGAKFVSLRSTTGISYTGVWNDGTNNPRLEISHTSTGTVLNATSSSGGAYSRLRLQAAGADQYQIDPLGIFTWYDGAGGTRMLLNATGLGVGGGPTRKLSIVGSGNTYANINSGDNTSLVGVLFGGTSAPSNGQIIYNNTDNSMGLHTAGAVKLTIDSSGQVGIGVQPSAWGSPFKGFDISSGGGIGGSSTSIRLFSNSFYNGSNYIYKNSAAAARYDVIDNTHAWYYAAGGTAGNAITFTQAMTLDSSGNLLVGTTGLNGSWNTKLTLSNDSGTTKWAVGPYLGGVTNFLISAGASAGVYLNGTAATSWTSASDERLKDIIEPISNAIAKVGSLRAVIGKFKFDENNTRKPFLIAQDVQSVLPEAVDASNPEKLGVAYTDVIPLLVAAIKELTAEVNALKNA